MKDSSNHNPTRRDFLGTTFTVVSAIWVGAILPRIASADEVTHVSESDPPAQALGYHEDAGTVDHAKYSKYAPGQMCANCKLFQGGGGSEYAPCQLYPGKAVHAKGWCSGYTAKTT